MDSFKVNFRCPTLTVKIVDELAAADHRDRTSMLNKIVDFYISHHPTPNHSNNEQRHAAPSKRKKAGAR
jgi:hypothetical protein